MTTSTTENEPAAQATAAAARKPEAPNKAHATARKPHVAPFKAKSRKKPNSRKKGTKSKQAGDGARQGSKTANVLGLLKRSGGATLKELQKATGWLPHSVRGFISGTLRKKMGLTVDSAEREDGERVYSLSK